MIWLLLTVTIMVTYDQTILPDHIGPNAAGRCYFDFKAPPLPSGRQPCVDNQGAPTFDAE